MEEDKTIRKKKILKIVSKIFSYIVISVLMFIASFLVIYVITSKLSKAQGKNPPFGLYTIISPSMTPNINVYDVVFIVKTDTDNVKVGDVITFYSTNSFFGGTPITHRVVEILDESDGSKRFKVKGDANPKADDEKVIPENVLGKVIIRFPQLGRVQFFLASKGGWLIAVMIPALVIISYDIYKIFRLILLRSKLLDMENKNGNI